MVVNSDESSAGHAPVPVAPGRLPLFGHALSLLRRPLDFMTSLRAHGDVVTIYLGTLPAYVLTDPELAYRVLTLEAGKFGKGIFIEKFRPYFGNGLALSTGDFYRRQRRLVQPAFHRDRVLGYARTMIELASAMVDGWRAGEEIAVDVRLRELGLAVVARTLFTTELGRRAADEVQACVPVLIRDGMVRALSPRLAPIPANRRFDLAIARVRRVVGEVVAEARASGADRGDLLSTLLLAEDPETGERMDDTQVHDEVVTLLTAGTDTSAIALAWFFHEIARHPEVERRFHAEVDAAVPDGRVTVDALPRLTYTRQVITEVLRTHGPWLLMRRALVEVDLGAVRLPPGAEVAISPHATHQDPVVYPDPARFDPDRWSPERAARVPKQAYLPFAAGLHSCPGQQFAHTEIALVAAAVAARWRLVPVPGKPVRPKVLGIVYPSRLPMTAVPRHG
jgi:cytochrome P450